MVIYLCMKELSKPGYKTCLISCRKLEQDGKQGSRFLEGIKYVMSHLPDGHLDQSNIIWNRLIINTVTQTEQQRHACKQLVGKV